MLAFAYYRKLGLSAAHALIGMAILAWGMSCSNYNSDLQSDTFFDNIFYLLAGLSILYGRFIWIVPITLFASLNRETSGLIPFLLLSFSMFAMPKGSSRKMMPIFITAVVLYVAVFVGLRFFYGSQRVLTAYGHRMGLDVLQYNLFRPATWQRLIATLSVIPILAIFGYRKCPLQLRVFFWTLVPIWFVIHALAAIMAETRLLLVPQAMVLIPGALFFAQKTQAPNDDAAELQSGP